MGIELNNQQIYAVYDLENWWNSSTKQVFEISGKAGTGKAQPIDTLIPTPDGFKKLGEIKIGDYVYNRHGNPVKVLGVYDQGELETFEVTFEDGRKTLCNDEHLWALIKNDNKLVTKTLKSIMKQKLLFNSLNRNKIPMNDVVQYERKNFKIDPYVIGIVISGILNKIIGKYDSRDDKIKELLSILNELLQNPYSTFGIPTEYFYGDEEQRWELIQGLFDVDGDILDDSDSTLAYFNKNSQLVKDVQQVLFSLGISSTVGSTEKENGTWYYLNVNVDNSMKYKFFRIDSEESHIALKLKEESNIKKYNKLSIVDIKDLGYKSEMRCIFVDDPEHLYLTNDYIVTHNTTLVVYLIERLGLKLDNVLFVAFMGKAASVLSRHGLPAKTIHSAIYDYTEVLDRDENGKLIILPNGKPKKKGQFLLKPTLGKKIKLIVVDEASMVSEKMAIDLLSFGVPVIALGDLNQLPPVFGNPYFLKEPDVILTQIMRQAEGNPIVWLGDRVLDGYDLPYGVYGTSSVIRKADLTDFHFRNNDMILTGTNRLRYNINNYCREEIKGIKNLEYPHMNEKVICKKNNWGQSIDGNIYLTNGLTGFVDYIYRDSFDRKTMKMDFRPDFTKKVFKNLRFDYNHMYTIPGKEDAVQDKFSFLYDKFEFAYAITTHSCLPLDTLVYTEDGIKPLGSLTDYKGKVYNGDYMEPVVRYINNGYDKLNDLLLSNGMKYSVTDYHRCFIMTKDGITMTYGKNISVGDTLLLRKGQNLYNEDKPYTFNVNDEIYDIINVMTEDLAILLGMLFNEEDAIKNNYILYSHYNKVNIDYFFNIIKKIFGYECDVYYYNYNDLWYIRINDTNIVNILSSIKGNKLSIPKCIMESSAKYQYAFIKGFFEYSQIILNQNDEIQNLCIDIRNKKLLYQIVMILNNIGVSTTIETKTYNSIDKVFFYLNMDKENLYNYINKIGFIDNDKNTLIISELNNSDFDDVPINPIISYIIKNNFKFIIVDNDKVITRKEWKKIKTRYNNSSTVDTIELIDIIINNYELVQVKEISSSYANTACLELPDTHKFLQNGILGGNSQGSQWENVIYLHEDFMRDKEDKKKLMYTAITRASESITIVI